MIKRRSDKTKAKGLLDLPKELDSKFLLGILIFRYQVQIALLDTRSQFFRINFGSSIDIKCHTDLSNVTGKGHADRVSR